MQSLRSFLPIVEDHINSKPFIHPSYCHPCSHQRLHLEPRNNRNLPLQPSGKAFCRGSSLFCIASWSTRNDTEGRSAHRAERRVAHQSHLSLALSSFAVCPRQLDVASRSTVNASIAMPLRLVRTAPCLCGRADVLPRVPVLGPR